MCAFLHVWSHLPWKPCFISFDVLLVDVVFQAPFFHMFETMFSCIPLPSGEKISHPETAQSKGLRHHGLGHKWKTIGEIIWNVELIVDLPRSLVLWLDLDSQRLSLPFFLKEDFSNKIDGWHFCHMQKTPPKIQQKPQGINLLDLSQDTIIIMGFIPAPKGPSPSTCPTIGLVLHETTEEIQMKTNMLPVVPHL